MNSTSPRTFQTFVLVLVVAGLLVLAAGGYLAPFQRVLLNPLVLAQTWVSTRYMAIQDFISSPADVTRLRQQNSDLEAENSRLQAQIIQLQQQVSEVQVLSALVNYAQSHPDNSYVAATVVGFDTSPFLKYVFINRGSDDGLRRGMPVVTNQGLVGRIDAVKADSARVQLITDPASHINVRLKQTGAEAVLTGSLTSDVSLDMIPQDVLEQPGDLVLTSGLGGNYPADILVGQITGVRKRAYELFQTASIQPVVDFARLRIVMVIINFRPVDTSSLVP